MPLSDFHIWSLPPESVREQEESIAFTTLDNDLSDGYESSILFGSENGLRKWRLTLPTLASFEILPLNLIGPNDGTMSREQYLWDLYSESKVTGKPFAYKSRRTEQYYLVKFADKELSYSSMKVKLYSTGIELKQVRQRGKYVFDPLRTDANSLWFDQTGHVGTTWRNRLLAGGHTHRFAATGDVVFGANPQNLLNTVRFSGTASTGRVISQNAAGADIAFPLCDVFIVMKMREATFSNNCGVFSTPSSFSYLTGLTADTKFQNTYGFQYRKSSVLFENTNRQAPMNTFAVVHVRFGIADEGSMVITLGQNLALAATFAKMDIAEIGFTSKTLSISDVRETAEYLSVKWGV